MTYTEKEYEKDRKRYGYLASLPILVAIVHLLFTIFFMSSVSFHEADGAYGNLFTLGELFSVSSFAAIILGKGTSYAAVKALPALLGVGIGLVEIFLSTFAVKGKKIYYKIAFFVYLFDFLFSFASIILSFTLKSQIVFQVYDIILNLVIHIIFSLLFVYGMYVIRRLDAYEEKKIQEQNQIHIER